MEILEQDDLAMHQPHGYHAQVSIAKHHAITHLKHIDGFLIDKAAFLTPSPLGCCQPEVPFLPLTLLAHKVRRDQKNTKSRIAVKRFGFFVFAAASLLATSHMQAQAETITVATAANFQQTLKALRQPFARHTGDKITIITGSSGTLASQIINGAPFDVFLSADETRPRQLIRRGVADRQTLTIYALGRLTLWSHDKNLIMPDSGRKILKTANFNHIAYANPRLAPYGAAAEQTLRSLNLLPALKAKVLHGENISQTFTLLATKAVPLGFISRAQLARQPWKNQGSAWHIPANLHQPIRQAAIVVKTSKRKPAARRFIRFLKSNPAKEIIRSFGYDTPSQND